MAANMAVGKTAAEKLSEELDRQQTEFDAAAKWLGLAVKRFELTDDSHAVVEFVARYKIGGRAHRLHETSRFIREDGRWLYLDGDIHPN